MKKTILTPLVLAATLSLVGCTGEEQAAPVKEKASAPAPVEDTSTEEPAPAEESPTEESEPTEEAPDTAALGDTVEVGNWDVKVTNVELNGNEAIKKANQFNDKPKGQYVIVTYEATYTGPERIGDTMMDLSWSFTTTDSQVNDPAMAVTQADNESWPTEARSAGTVKQQVVFDLPPNAVKGGILTVETYDENFDVVFADFKV